MKIASWDTLIDEKGYSQSVEFERARIDLESAIQSIVWPAGAADFAIYPESGKARGAGNGVVPIKRAFASAIAARGWELEKNAPTADGEDATIKGSRPGAFDAHLTFDQQGPQPFVAEW